MPFEILSVNGASGERWSELVAALPKTLQDIHYRPDYGRIYRDVYGYEPLLAVYREGEGFVLQAFVRRSLNELPFLTGASVQAVADIANPYGYGGPLCAAAESGTARNLYARFAENLAKWCEQERIASEFTSLHPLLIEHQLPLLSGALQATLEKSVVVIPLFGDDATLRAGLSRGNKSSIAKAERSGVTVEKVEASSANLAVFNEIYYDTMRRRGAAERWHFPESYFATCVRHLGADGASLFFARIANDIESVYLLIHGFTTAYYHFGGSRELQPEVRANNLLMYETARWTQVRGYSHYHLGGGVTRSADDSLLRFKAGFSSQRAPLYTYFCIRNREIYDQLSERKREFERTTLGAELMSDYRPLYRR